MLLTNPHLFHKSGTHRIKDAWCCCGRGWGGAGVGGLRGYYEMDIINDQFKHPIACGAHLPGASPPIDHHIALKVCWSVDMCGAASLGGLGELLISQKIIIQLMTQTWTEPCLGRWRLPVLVSLSSPPDTRMSAGCPTLMAVTTANKNSHEDTRIPKIKIQCPSGTTSSDCGLHTAVDVAPYSNLSDKVTRLKGLVSLGSPVVGTNSFKDISPGKSFEHLCYNQASYDCLP